MGVPLNLPVAQRQGLPVCLGDPGFEPAPGYKAGWWLYARAHILCAEGARVRPRWRQGGIASGSGHPPVTLPVRPGVGATRTETPTATAVLRLGGVPGAGGRAFPGWRLPVLTKPSAGPLIHGGGGRQRGKERGGQIHGG